MSGVLYTWRTWSRWLMWQTQQINSLLSANYLYDDKSWKGSLPVNVETPYYFEYLITSLARLKVSLSTILMIIRLSELIKMKMPLLQLQFAIHLSNTGLLDHLEYTNRGLGVVRPSKLWYGVRRPQVTMFVFVHEPLVWLSPENEWNPNFPGVNKEHPPSFNSTH